MKLSLKKCLSAALIAVMLAGTGAVSLAEVDFYLPEDSDDNVYTEEPVPEPPLDELWNQLPENGEPPVDSDDSDNLAAVPALFDSLPDENDSGEFLEADDSIPVHVLQDLLDLLGDSSVTEAVFTLKDDLTLDDDTLLRIDAGKKITIRSADSPHTIFVSDTLPRRHFSVAGDLTLDNVILDGRSTAGGIGISGTVTLKNTVIENCIASSNGGGISVGNGFLFIEEGTVIRNCSAKRGGGVYVNGPGEVIMNGGTIEHCVATENGGAVFLLMSAANDPLERNGTLTMNGGLMQHNESNGGGAVYVDGGGYVGGGMYACGFHMYGGIIDSNTATGGTAITGAGGAVFANGDFFMHDGTLSNNKATSTTGLGGGAVYVSESGSVTVEGGIIEGNQSATHGGGICVSFSQLTMTGGAVQNNTAASWGGGIVIMGLETSDSTVEIENMYIAGNQAARGGGIGVSAGLLIMKSGTIERNTAVDTGATNSGLGGGAFLTDVFRMEGGSINGNSAEIDGGGVYIRDSYDAYLAVSGPSYFIGNRAPNGDGGGIFTQAYNRLETGSSTTFLANWASSAQEPPNDPSSYPLIDFAATSIADHPLNNYDINYSGSSPINPDDLHTNLVVEVVDKKTREHLTGVTFNLYFTLDSTNYYYSLDQDGITWTTSSDSAYGFVSDSDGFFAVDGLRRNVLYYLEQAEEYPNYQEIDTEIIETLDQDNSKLVEAEPIEEKNTGKPRPSKDRYTVYFHRNDSSADDLHKTVAVPSGSTVTEPAVPEREGFQFDGWYTEKACRDLYDFKTPVTKDIHLYAGWIMDLPFDSDHFAYIVGYTDGTVRPQDNITRAEATSIFFRLISDEFREQMWNQSNSFLDVNSENWHNTAVSTMTKAGIVNGYQDGTFRPDDPITRAELAVVVSLFVNEAYTGSNQFPDIEDHWAQQYINLAADLGWLSGYTDGTFRPDSYITRAETASLINRVTGRTPYELGDLSSTMKQWPDNSITSAWFYLDIQEATNSHYYELLEDHPGHEHWTGLRENRDWAALERPGSSIR